MTSKLFKAQFGLVVLIAVFCSGCTSFGAVSLSADPISSQVVDEDTNQPIEGAVVVAQWDVHQGSIGGGSLPCATVSVEEAVTDKDGRFHLPGWGPTRAGCGAEMRIDNPHLYIFKSGYWHGFFHNGSGVTTVTTTHSSFDGKQMPLIKVLDMDLKKHGIGSYQFDFGTLNTYLINFTANMPEECNWKKIPAMLSAVAQQESEFEHAGNPIGTVNSQLIANDQSLQKIAPQCGSPKIFIEGLSK